MTFTFDEFPAQVTVPGGSFQKARAALTAGGRLLVWVEPARGQTVPPVAWDVWATGEAIREPVGRRTQWTIPTAAGDVVVMKQGGCGCGAKLKSRNAATLLAAMASV